MFQEHDVRDRIAGGTAICLALLLALTLVRGVIYATVVPPWQAPDETGHFEYAWLVARLGRLPGRNDVSLTFERELIGSLYEWRFGEFIGRPLPEGMPARLDDLPSEIFATRSRTVRIERFSPSYLWQSLFLIPMRFQELAFQLLIARLSSVILNVAIVWLAFKTLSDILHDRSFLVCAMTSVIVFLPQHTFINSMVGDGPLAEFMVCVVLYCWVQVFRRGVSVWTLLGILVGTVIGVWSKATAAFLIPLNAGLAIWWFFRQPHLARKWRYAVLVSIAFALLVTALWLWLGPDSGLVTQMDFRHLLNNELAWADARGLTLGQALLVSHDSFWANFGWMAVPVGSRWYGALLLLAGLALCGWLFERKNWDVALPWAAVLMWAFFLTALLVFVWVALLFPASGYYQVQGRYLFPVIVPFAFLLVGGWSRLVQPRLGHVLVWSGVAFLALLDFWCILGYIVPYFYA